MQVDIESDFCGRLHGRAYLMADKYFTHSCGSYPSMRWYNCDRRCFVACGRGIANTGLESSASAKLLSFSRINGTHPQLRLPTVPFEHPPTTNTYTKNAHLHRSSPLPPPLGRQSQRWPHRLWLMPNRCVQTVEIVLSSPSHPRCTHVGCNTVAVACYAAAGFTFGTVIAAPATPAAILGCNSALGVCSATCATLVLFAPTP